MAKAYANEDEDEEIKVDEEKLVEESKKGEYSRLVGKLHAERLVSKDVLRSTLLKIWKKIKPFFFNDINPYLYVITFESIEDKYRVLCGRLWLSDSLFIFLETF